MIVTSRRDRNSGDAKVAGTSRSPLLRLPMRSEFFRPSKNQELLAPAAPDCAWFKSIEQDLRRRARLEAECLAEFNQPAALSTYQRGKSVRTTRATALFGFVRVNQATLPVRAMCRLLNISKSGYYAWDERPMCERERFDIALTGQIEAIHRRSRGAYGSPNIHAELADDHGIRVGRKRVARLMRAAHIRGVTLRRFVVTTRRDPGAKPVVDLVERRFYAEAPNRLWVADATYIPTWAGFLYLAMVLDVYSRKVVGWGMGNQLNTELMLAALDMAIAQRRPRGVIHHSDRGCEYTSYAFGKRCTEAGIRPSMGRVGDAYDNAMAESFFATLEREVIDRQRFHSQIDARMAVFTWLESWYNPHRRHSSFGYRSPMNYERHALRQRAA